MTDAAPHPADRPPRGRRRQVRAVRRMVDALALRGHRRRAPGGPQRRSGVFDVSHLGTVFVDRRRRPAVDRASFTNDPAALDDGASQYTLCCDERGRHRRRPHRLPPGRRPLADGPERGQHRRGRPAAPPSRPEGRDGRAVERPERRLGRPARCRVRRRWRRSRDRARATRQRPDPRRRAPPGRRRRRRVADVGSCCCAARGTRARSGAELLVPAVLAPAVWDALVAAGADAVRTRRTRHAAAGDGLPAPRQRPVDRRCCPARRGSAGPSRLDRGQFVGRDALLRREGNAVRPVDCGDCAARVADRHAPACGSCRRPRGRRGRPPGRSHRRCGSGSASRCWPPTSSRARRSRWTSAAARAVRGGPAPLRRPRPQGLSAAGRGEERVRGAGRWWGATSERSERDGDPPGSRRQVQRSIRPTSLLRCPPDRTALVPVARSTRSQRSRSPSVWPSSSSGHLGVEHDEVDLLVVRERAHVEVGRADDARRGRRRSAPWRAASSAGTRSNSMPPSSRSS